MSDQVRRVRIFLGSPSDAVPFRHKVRKKIESAEFQDTQDQLNIVIRVSEGDDTTPQIGTDGQGIINENTVSKADIAIVFLHHKLGLETVRAESGTADEARYIVERYKRGENCQLMVFFCTRYDDDKLVLAELERLRAFKDSIRQEGILTRDFADIDDLLPKIPGFLVDLIKRMEEKDKPSVPFSSSESTGENGLEKSSETDDVGLLDLQEDAENAISDMTANLGEISAKITEVGRISEQAVSDLNDGSLAQDKAKVRQAIDSVSDTLDDLSETIETRMAVMTDSYRRTIEFVGIVTSLDSGEDSKAFSETIRGLPSAALKGMGSLAGMQQSVSELPRLTTKLNKSKKRASKAMSNLIEETMSFAQEIEDVATRS